MHNIFGQHLSFLSFGESHSRAVGGVLDGVPAGIPIRLDLIREALDRRAGRTATAGISPRAKREPDEVEWLSGVVEKEGQLVSLGSPIAFLIRNADARPEDYEWLRHSFRPAHADRTYIDKYGIRDHRGGGRASARETVGRVVAGEIAAQMLSSRGVTIHAELIQVGAETHPEKFDSVIRSYQEQGDSIGGIIRCTVTGLPAGLGDPIFDKLQSHLAYAMLSINACKGFDYGSGFEQIAAPGSVANLSSGGLLGGITDGTTLSFRCVFKPTPTTAQSLAQIAQPSIVQSSDRQSSNRPFRSDACVAVRAVPVVEAMTALVLENFFFGAGVTFPPHPASNKKTTKKTYYYAN